MLISSLAPPSSLHPSSRAIERTDPILPTVVIRLKQLKRDLIPLDYPHACSAKVCNPQSEEVLTKGGMGCISTNVFLCRYGVVHVCSIQSCEHYASSNIQTCHISGFQLASITHSYDKNNQKTWYSKPEYEESSVVHSTKKRKIRILTTESVLDRASDIVKLLLFSNNRHKRNLDAIKEFQNEANDAKNTYAKSQFKQQQQPFWTDVYRIRALYTSQALPLKEYEFNDQLHKYYIGIVVQVHELALEVFSSSEKNILDSICIGVLYAMQKGVTLQGTIILPKDEFLETNLPHGNELPYFGLERNRIGKSDKLIRLLYERAVEQGVAIERMIIKYERI